MRSTSNLNRHGWRWPFFYKEGEMGKRIILMVVLLAVLMTILWVYGFLELG